MIETTALNGMFILFSAIVVFAVWAGTRAYYIALINKLNRAWKRAYDEMAKDKK